MASKISSPEYAKAVAEAYINGVSTAEMADIFGVTKDTVRNWSRDPRVLAHGGKLAQERVLRITRLIDKEFESRLEDMGSLESETLLRIRKEYLERTVRFENIAADTTGTVGETVKALEENPELAKALTDLMAGKTDDSS